MEDSFYFSLLRISVAQILKASGFDKCKPSVLNFATDLYIKHLQLVLSSAGKFSAASGNSPSELDGSDVFQALLDVGFLKPQKSDVPGQDDDRVNTKSLDSFLKWTKYSDSFAVSKKLSAVPTPLLYNLMEKRKIDTSSETDQEKKRRRLRERQEFYNQLKQGEDTAVQDGDEALMEDLDDEELTANDRLSWLAYLTEKDMKLGQNMKFVDSCIQDYLMKVHQNKKFHPSVDSEDGSFINRIHSSSKNDYLLLQIQDVEESPENGEHTVLPSEELKSSLPYNVRYNKALLDDDLDQYFEYASSHQEEITQRLAEVEKLRELAAEKRRLRELELEEEKKKAVPEIPEVPEMLAVPEVLEVPIADKDMTPESISENTDTDSTNISKQVVEKIGAEALGADLLASALPVEDDPVEVMEEDLEGSPKDDLESSSAEEPDDDPDYR